MRAKHSIAVLLLLIAWCVAPVLKAADDHFLNLASQSTLPQGLIGNCFSRAALCLTLRG